MGKVILYYEDFTGYEMLDRCLRSYLLSKNSKTFGINSITIYSNELRTAYLKRSKQGTITGKSWITKEKKEL